ncbi:hypothetical protein KIH27_21280 [Mycobacterium sp. M1]|uniref:Uncharacterized protein n=1 Tax=Mycolicibacter acidiphilus TaxID=2835306 RepID=A0ABS5RP93_9MYCO|nr:hypothetical protein [Mycolicibacter acidiphilus]MBS9536120.1 hypothetical protein [Mycolicibacter acidiphilus]
MTMPERFFGVERRWRAVRDTPLAPLAEALVRQDGIYQSLVELGWSNHEQPVTLIDCAFDNQNGWHWLDAAVDSTLTEAWLDQQKQKQVRALLDARLVYFKLKPTGDVIRVWWKSPRNKGTRLAKG